MQTGDRDDLRDERRQDEVREREPEHRSGEATPGQEPFLGFDGLATDDLLEWIDEADPDPRELRAIFDYEGEHRGREAVLSELKERLRRAGERPE